MSAYYSAEFADIMADEAQEFSQNELERLSGSNRCTSNVQITPGMLLTFMPGVSETGLPPKGLTCLKRVFVDNQQRGEETKQRWGFVQSFSWDNVEWSRKELQADGLGEEDYYSWTPEERKEVFLGRTDFGATLSAITDKFLREAWLDGLWGVFQGQYFTNFSYERHTKPAEEIELKPWWRRWISGDWGHDHPAVHAHQSGILMERAGHGDRNERWQHCVANTELGQQRGEPHGVSS